jgi:Mrp family chromosome partitioning ATPase
MTWQPVSFEGIRNPGSGQADCGLGHACSFCQRESTCALDKPAHNRLLSERRLAAMGRIVMVLANKGGVGKSTVAANLAAALSARGFRVGLADADIHGPNAAQFFGQQGERVRITERGITPRRYRAKNGVTDLKLGSLGFFLSEDDAPVVWRDAYKFDYIHHLVGSYDWGELDFWVIDMPPGTGNELITLCDLLEGQNLDAILVTTPQAVALLDTLKAARFCRERGVPLLGVIENMAGIVCPHCAGEIVLYPRSPRADDLHQAGVETIGKLPMSPALAFGSDEGCPVVDSAPESPESRVFFEVASLCIERSVVEQSALLEQQLGDLLADPTHIEFAEAEGQTDGENAAGTQAQLRALLEQERQRLGKHRS